MGNLVGAHPGLPYEERLNILRTSHIALWDVLASCTRATSLDSRIKQEIANDFTFYFAQHPQIARVFFNGSKAEQSFMKFVLNRQTLPQLKFHRLPSTSPAHAGMNFPDKLRTWRAAISVFL